MKDSLAALEVRSITQITLEVSFASLLFVSASLENIVMIFVVFRRRQLRTIPNLFVLNLSLANLLLAFTVLPVFVVTLVKGKWVFGETFCKILGYQINLLFAVTLFTVTTISLNRYVLICYPGKYSAIFNKKLVLKIILAIWISCAMICSSPLLGWGHFSFNSRTALCHTDPSSSSFKIAVNGFMLIDVVVIVFCNVKIVQTVRAHRKRVTTTSVSLRNPRRNEQPKENENGTRRCNNLAFQKQQLNGDDNNIQIRREIHSSEKRQHSENNVVAANLATLEVPERFTAFHAHLTGKTSEQTSSRKPGPVAHELRGEEIHITRTTSLIVLVFCACWMPCFIMDSMEAFEVFAWRELRMAGIYLIFLDTVLGPFIYGMRVRKLRQAVTEVIKCGL